MTGTEPARRVVVSLLVWWLLLAFVLWLLGKVLDQPASVAQCAASSAFFVVLGEAGDWLRRRWRTKKVTTRHGPAPSRSQPSDSESPTAP